jgi:hypothetical protein
MDISGLAIELSVCSPAYGLARGQQARLRCPHGSKNSFLRTASCCDARQDTDRNGAAPSAADAVGCPVHGETGAEMGMVPIGRRRIVVRSSTYSITSSAIASTCGGIERPSALAVFVLSPVQT